MVCRKYQFSYHLFSSLILLFAVLLFLPSYSYGVCLDTWTSVHPSGTSHNWTGVAFKGTRMVVVGNDGRIEFSDDQGSTWDGASCSEPNDFRDLIYCSSKGLFVAVADHGHIWTSSNGSVWTERTSGTTINLTGVCWTGTKFIAVGLEMSCSSTDGITWSNALRPNKNMIKICSNGSGILVAAGNIKVYRSDDDGSSWTGITVGSSQMYKSVSYGSGRFVVGSSSGQIWYSADNGLNWAQASGTGSNGVYDIKYYDSTFVGATDFGSSKNMITSTNGTTWTMKRVGASTTFYLRGVGYNGSKIFIVGQSMSVFKSCSDDIPKIYDPVKGSTLDGTTDSFHWTQGDPAITQYKIDIGSQAGGSDIGSQTTTGYSLQFTNLPNNGQTVYVKFSWLIGSSWLYENYTYIAFNDGSEIYEPANRTNLTSSSVDFSWYGCDGASQYHLHVGTLSNPTQFKHYTTTIGTTVNVTLPTDGSTIYAHLYTTIDSDVYDSLSTYTAYKPLPEDAHTYMTGGSNKIRVVHRTSDEHEYYHAGTNQLAYTMQIIRDIDADKYYSIYHGEPNKEHVFGDGVKVAVQSGTFNYTMSTPYHVLWGTATDINSRIYSSDTYEDIPRPPTYAGHPWLSVGGAGNPMVCKAGGKYYVFFVAVTDTDGDRANENDFSHFLGVARTTHFHNPKTDADDWELRTELYTVGNILWKPWWRPMSGDTYGWNRPRCLDDKTSHQLTSIKTDYAADDDTQGLLGSISYYNGKYWFFYTDKDTDSSAYLYYRTTTKLDDLAQCTEWTAAKKANPNPLMQGNFYTLVKVAPAHNLDCWAVTYTALSNQAVSVPDVMVQYTENMNVDEGSGGISDIVFFDSGFFHDSHYLGREIGNHSHTTGGTCTQHFFMTDPLGRLEAPGDGEKPDNATTGGMVTFTDTETHGLTCDYIYTLGWDLLFYQAMFPSPAKGATGVSTSADLSWTAGYKATYYNVYFGTSSNPPQVAEQVETTYDPGTLQSGTTYYWRIDAVNGDNDTVTTGKLWSFTTN